jgi:hypothetical protein
MAKPHPSTADIGQRLAEVSGLLDRAVAVLTQTLTEIKEKEEVDYVGGQSERRCEGRAGHGQ